MCVCVCVCKRPQTLRTKRVIWGYPASSYYSPGKKRKEKKAKYYKINLFFFLLLVSTLYYFSECWMRRIFIYLPPKSQPPLHFFFGTATHLSVSLSWLISSESGFHRQADLVALGSNGTCHETRANWFPPVSTNSFDRLPRNQKKKNDRKETFKRKRYNTIYVWFHFNVAVKIKEAKVRWLISENGFVNKRPYVIFFHFRRDLCTHALFRTRLAATSFSLSLLQGVSIWWATL